MVTRQTFTDLILVIKKKNVIPLYASSMMLKAMFIINSHYVTTDILD